MRKSFFLCTSLTVFMFSVVASFSDEADLLAFKSHITLDPGFIITDNWLTGSTYCSWIGVSCGHGGRRVISLILPNMGLRGTIAPELGNLSFLTVFNISFNSFHGQLPDEMGHLRRLKVIDLQHNLLTGGIPKSLSVLPNLRSLNLSFNNFTGKIPAAPLHNVSNHVPGSFNPQEIHQHKNKGSEGRRSMAGKNPFRGGDKGLTTPPVTSAGKKEMSSSKYRLPTRPSHSSSPSHSGPNTSPGKPPL